MLRLRTATLGLVLVLAACSGDARISLPPRGENGTATAPEIPADAPTVVFLGDSITAGFGLDPDEAFPAILQAALADEGLPFHLVNAGVSGDTSAGGLRRLDWVMKSEPDVLVVELGGNDGLRGQAVDGIEANLRAIVERAEEKDVRVLLLGMRIPPSYGADYATSFAALYEHLARDEELAFLPFFMEGVGGDPRLNQADGLHPTADGHRRLAENVLPVLRGLLAK